MADTKWLYARLPETMAYNRWRQLARQRAAKRLSYLHPEDFDALFTEELEAGRERYDEEVRAARISLP